MSQNIGIPQIVQMGQDSTSGASTWGSISGLIADQADLQTALDGKASLVNGKIQSSELPSYVDDVIESADFASLPTTGEQGKIYITINDGKIFRWSGSIYVEISPSGGSAVWGSITGTLSNQTDLQTALDGKSGVSHTHTASQVTDINSYTGSLTNKTLDSYTNFIHADGVHLRVKATETLSVGDVIKFVGFNSGENAIEVAKRNTMTSEAIGVMHDALTVGSFGMAISSGYLKNINTLAYTEGTILYPNTSGGFTTTPTIANGNYNQPIAYVLRSHGVNGIIMINVGPGHDIASLVAYDNTISGMTATNVKSAIDELKSAQSNFATGGGTATGTNTGDETTSTIKTKLGITTLSGSNTGDQTSIVGITGTIAQFNTACTDADFATGGGTATGTNTGDQTSIVGITGTKAQFNTAVTDGDIIYSGDALGTPSSGTLTNCTVDGTNKVGYLNIPQNSQSSSYTTVLSDAGKYIYHPMGSGNSSITIDSSIGYSVGTAITFINDKTGGDLSINISNDIMVLAGTGSEGARILYQNGIATAIKVSAGRWIISGINLA